MILFNSPNIPGTWTSLPPWLPDKVLSEVEDLAQGQQPLNDT